MEFTKIPEFFAFSAVFRLSGPPGGARGARMGAHFGPPRGPPKSRNVKKPLQICDKPSQFHAPLHNKKGGPAGPARGPARRPVAPPAFPRFRGFPAFSVIPDEN